MHDPAPLLFVGKREAGMGVEVDEKVAAKSPFSDSGGLAVSSAFDLEDDRSFDQAVEQRHGQRKKTRRTDGQWSPSRLVEVVTPRLYGLHLSDRCVPWTSVVKSLRAHRGPVDPARWHARPERTRCP